MTIKLLGADLFCGAGGFTKGTMRALRALGAEVELVAVNHWPVAIATHSKNYPTVRHYVEDLDGADPQRLVPEGRLDFLTASPECRYHSRARGGKPINDQRRMSAWAVQRWLTALDVRTLLIENVPEFVDWGPLCTLPRDHDGPHRQAPLPGLDVELCDRPLPEKKGLYFQAWVEAIWKLGYRFEWAFLNCADYGDVTTRVRFFGMGRKDGLTLAVPEPTHRRPDGRSRMAFDEHRLPWRVAREVIDWSDRGRSLFEDPKYKKKPLSPKTMARIGRGLKKYTGPYWPLYHVALGLLPPRDPTETNAPTPFTLGQNFNNVAKSADTHPLPTVTTVSRIGVVEPVIEHLVGANRNNCEPKPDTAPVPTITATGRGGLYAVEASVQSFTFGNRAHNAPKGVDEPIPTVTTAHGGGIAFTAAQVAPFILGQQSAAAARSSEEPLPTVATDGAISLVQPLVSSFYGRTEASSIDEPLPTITTKARHSLVEPIVDPFLLNRHGADVGTIHSAAAPMPTITGSGGPYLVEPFVVPYRGERAGQSPRLHSVDEPLPTITAGGKGAALAEPIILRTTQPEQHGAHVRSTEEPLYTITAKRDLALVEAMVEPILTTIREGKIDPRRVVYSQNLPGVPDGWYVLDVLFRMLRNRELARATGFDDEESTYEFVGNVEEVTQQIGNAIPVRTATELMKALLRPMLQSGAVEAAG